MKKLILLALSLSMLSSCMFFREARVGRVGQSVNSTLYEQIADKATAANPGTEVSPTGTDGPMVEKVMDGYRGKTGDAQQVGQPIQINIQ
jgi:hypothetical protein